MTDSTKHGLSIADMRREYRQPGFDNGDVDPDPFRQFEVWFQDAVEARVIESNAMILATATPDGHPSVRVVLLKGMDDDGFVFYTNYDSGKGQDMAAHPRAALLFFWAELERQVRISGDVSKVSREEAAEYFQSRPRESQIGAWVSPQSQPIPHRNVLQENFDALTAQHEGAFVPLPPFWGGYRVSPEQMEFWQGRPNRLHDRLLYTRADGKWKRVRLAP